VVIVMAPAAGGSDLSGVVAHVEAAGGAAFVSRGVNRTIVGVVGDERVLESIDLAHLPGVVEVVRITSPYKLVSREHNAGTSTVFVGGVPIGPDTVTLIAGPCAVETPEQTLAAAVMARDAGAALLRGGAYKPRTSPYAFQGLGIAGLRILAEVSAEVGLPAVTEVVDVGGVGRPVLLKRGLTATYEEWLMAAEYIAQRGNLDIVLCERGIRTFETATRNTLDVAAVPMIRAVSHLPIIIDPSHAGGRRDLVLPLARAGLAAGADGLIVDVHPHPEAALVDGAQALSGESLDALAAVVRTVPSLMGRALAAPPTGFR
jgi:3-deoxy-7-phosphoheptulonate synthase